MKNIKSYSFLGRLLKNWPIKIIALIVAFFVYVLAFYAVNTPRTVSIPVTVILPEEYEPFSNVPDSVSIAVHATGDAKYMVDPSLVTAKIDFSFVNAQGVFAAPIELEYNTGVLRHGVVEIVPHPLTARIAFQKKGL